MVPDAFDFFLDRELVLVAGVLVVASSAVRIIRTGRGRAMRRRFCDAGDPGAGEARLLFGDGGLDFLSRENKGDEYGLAAPTVVGGQARQSVAAIDELFNV